MSEKWDDFENWKNGHNAKGIAFPNLSLGQKIKFPKTCEKLFYKHITDVLCRKRLKKQLIFEKWDDFENWKTGHNAKGITFPNLSLGQKIKLPKTCEKLFYKHITDVLCRKRLQKTINLREVRRFWKLEKWPQCKRYSLSKSQFGSKNKIT